VFAEIRHDLVIERTHSLAFDDELETPEGVEEGGDLGSNEVSRFFKTIVHRTSKALSFVKPNIDKKPQRNSLTSPSPSLPSDRSSTIDLQRKYQAWIKDTVQNHENTSHVVHPDMLRQLVKIMILSSNKHHLWREYDLSCLKQVALVF
jgi:hypothetical protein